MTTNNPYTVKFNRNANYSITPDGGVSIIPFQRNKVRQDVVAADDSKNYINKFFDKNIYEKGDSSIRLDPETLEDIKRKSVTNKKKVGNVYTQTYSSYINIDSRQRLRYPENIYGERIWNLPSNPIKFTNGSSLITVNLEDHPFEVNDNIILNNVISKTVALNNVLMVKKNSLFMRIFYNKHGLSLYGLYNPSNASEFQVINYIEKLPVNYDSYENIPDSDNRYYILKDNTIIDLTIQISNVKGSDLSRDMIGNIPVNYINRKQTVYLLFIKNGTEFISDPDSFLIMLERKSSINYQDGRNYISDVKNIQTTTLSTNDTVIKYCNLYGIPLNYLNSGSPITQNNKYMYMNILSVTKDTFIVDCHYNSIVDPYNSFYNDLDHINNNYYNTIVDFNVITDFDHGGGNQCYTRKIESIRSGYPNPNDYVIKLDKTYKNVIQCTIISSSFPNSQKIINDKTYDINNNKLYWRNLDDGNHIYHLNIIPGNYSPNELARAIEKQFSKTLRHKYIREYEDIIPINNVNIFDEFGYNKYHIVKVDIDVKTDVVTFSSFQQIKQIDKNDYNLSPILYIPDHYIDLTAAENVQINFGIDGTGIVPEKINPFSPEIGEFLFIYFTPNCHIRIDENFTYVNYNLYRYIGMIHPHNSKVNGYNTYRVELERNIAILVNFYRTQIVYDVVNPTQEINSINTTTTLQNAEYNYLTNNVLLPNHQLKIGDIIITDTFFNPEFPNAIFVFEIITIINSDSFIVIRVEHGKKFKFIYDGILINFSIVPLLSNAMNSYYWMDQICSNAPIQQINEYGNNNTLSYTAIVSSLENKQIMKVKHPFHQIKIGDIITINNSISINNVPSKIINRSHIVDKILNDDYYEVLLDVYIPFLTTCSEKLNTIIVTYPNIFQLLFNYEDTLGNLLSFNKVGTPVAITPYRHIIRNTDEYSDDYNYNTLGNEYEIRLKKLNMTGPEYFYIVCPQLAYFYPYHNTAPVTNVFSKIRWFNDPGEMTFDSFVPSVQVYDQPVDVLYELHIQIRHPDGRLVEFNGLDHSFVIEIVEVWNQPEEIDISEKIDAQIIVKRTN